MTKIKSNEKIKMRDLKKSNNKNLKISISNKEKEKLEQSLSEDKEEKKIEIIVENTEMADITSESYDSEITLGGSNNKFKRKKNIKGLSVAIPDFNKFITDDKKQVFNYLNIKYFLGQKLSYK